MSQIELAVKCRTCGRWRGILTHDIRKAKFSCLKDSCSDFMKPKTLYSTPYGFNFKIKFLKIGEKINELVSRLNKAKDDE